MCIGGEWRREGMGCACERVSPWSPCYLLPEVTQQGQEEEPLEMQGTKQYLGSCSSGRSSSTRKLCMLARVGETVSAVVGQVQAGVWHSLAQVELGPMQSTADRILPTPALNPLIPTCLLNPPIWNCNIVICLVGTLWPPEWAYHKLDWWWKQCAELHHDECC